jgi:predicted transcriptional regulator
MKFISKNSNLNIILRPGQQAQPLTGTPAVSALSVRFQNGMAEISDEKLIEMMLLHPAFNQDFISVEEGITDPYAYRRGESEPQHVTTEIKYGHPVARSASPVATQTSPELKKMIAEAAASIVEQQRPALMKEAIEAAMSILAAQQAAAQEASTGDAKGATTTQEASNIPTEQTKNKTKGAK